MLQEFAHFDAAYGDLVAQGMPVCYPREDAQEVCDSEMPIGESDLLTRITGYRVSVSLLATRFWARIVD